MAQDLASWTPSTASSIAQQALKSKAALRYAISAQMALMQAKKLTSAWPHARPPDPDGYAASLAAVLAGYPLGVVEECCDPRTGLARSREFPPTVAAVVEWCDRRVKHHRGMVKWGERIRPEAEFSDEHRKSMLNRLQALMHTVLKRSQLASKLEVGADG